jgi:hypothetical protein
MWIECHPDEERLKPIRECMETYGIGEGEEEEWPHNCISRRAIAYSCGAVVHDGGVAEHRHDAAEFALCRRIASEAAEIMAGVEVGMGSNASSYFEPFYVVADLGRDRYKEIHEATIHEVFGGTIYPPTEIFVEPLAEYGEWWEQVRFDCGSELEDTEEVPSEDVEECLRPWRRMIHWFHLQTELHSRVFVRIGEDPLSEENLGCVYPRLALSLTQAGSLVGICGHVVHT